MRDNCAVHHIFDEPCPICELHQDAIKAAGYDGQLRLLKAMPKIVSKGLELGVLKPREEQP